MHSERFNERVLSLDQLDLSVRLGDADYEHLSKKYALDLVRIQTRIKTEKLHVVLVFEGVDAAGKGGAIKRLTQNLDPRNLDVHGIGAPSEDERRHHYLRRFWVRLPPAGKLALFDRSWYGRMLVEPIEGFCTPAQYERAPREIREFERALADEGYILLKFWLHVDKDEQLKRFKERESDPLKEWKIGPEDWRNRERFDDYVTYANRMFAETDSSHAPWHLISGNDKQHARIEVMRLTAERLSPPG